MNKDDKIEVMVNDWVDGADMQTLCEYAASKLTEHYESLSEDKFDEYYEDFANENQML
jgi:hypothetical protein|tara:strand:+ start:431 stop:604 length:174 start_codon:yes stop_codon:yes gene_type:complete